MGLQPGARIGAYDIVSLLGAGGMGEVYRARDTRLQRDVAIKIVPESLAADPVARARFETEARAVASLSHPNIIAIHDFGIDGSTAFAVMELLDGRTLRELLADGPLPTRKATEYGAQIAAGLAAAHARGVVHRDLKPENVFVTRDGRAKILDFGLAKPMAHLAANAGTVAATYTPTSPGTVLGTVGYMAPEQVRGEAVDQRSDIFSLGTILYECFSGRRAFSGPSAVETMNAILKEEPPELTISNLPPAIDRIIRRALEKDPAARFQSAQDLGYALEALSGGTTQPALAQPALERPRRRLPMPLVLTIAVLAAAGGGFAAARALAPSAASTPISFEPRTWDPVAIWNARFIGTDGTIVYSASPKGNSPQLYAVRPGSPVPQRIGPPATHLLSVSSKGELAVLTNVKYVQQRIFAGTLARMPLDGAPRPWMEHIRDADWSPDGSTLAVVRDTSDGDILEYPIGTAVHKAPGYLSDVRVSPDGNHVAFMEHPSRFDDRGVVKIWDRGGSVRTVTGEYWGEEGLAWAPDGATVYFAAATVSGVYQLHAANASGDPHPRAVLPTPDTLYAFDISKDRRWLVSRYDRHTDIRIRLASDGQERTLPWMDSVWFPKLSSDGRQLLFSDGNYDAGPNYAVALRQTDGSPAVRLGEGDARALSPDGKYALAYIYNPPKTILYPTGAGDPITVTTALQNAQPQSFMPDGKGVVMCGNEPGKPARCYAQPLGGGAATPLTPEGFITNGVFSRDGAQLIASDAVQVPHLIERSSLAARTLPGANAGDIPVAWSSDGRAVFMTPPSGMQIERVDVATGMRSLVHRFEVADGPGIMSAQGASVTTDGLGYAYYYVSGLSRLFVVTGAGN